MHIVTARTVLVVIVISVVVVGDTRDAEELSEPIDHVADHRSLEFREQEEKQELVHLQACQVEGDASKGDSEEHLMEEHAEEEGHCHGLEHCCLVPHQVL